jgi:branched-chain amino acid aminotransferase
MSRIWHNGAFADITAPVFAANDRIRLGDAVFDTMLSLGGTLCHAQNHFSRLLAHAGILGIGVHKSIDELTQAAQSLLQENNFTQGRFAVNTVISRGPGARGAQPPGTADIQIVMSASPVADAFPPIPAIIAQTVRRNEGSPLSRIKSANYGDNILAQMEAREKNAAEAVMLNNKGSVACFSTGNLFAVLSGVLATPPMTDGAMDGIVRQILLERHGAVEKSLSVADLQSSEGIYITNSIRGATPLASLDGKTLPIPAMTFDPDFYLS